MRFPNTLDPRLRGDDGLFAFIVIPAQAGIQSKPYTLNRTSSSRLEMSGKG